MPDLSTMPDEDLYDRYCSLVLKDEPSDELEALEIEISRRMPPITSLLEGLYNDSQR